MKRLLLTAFALLALSVTSAYAEIKANGVVNAIKADVQKVNLTHDPIPSIGWPAMTMDIKVAPELDLSNVKAGSKIEFTLEKGDDGIFMIKTMEEK